MEREVNLTCVMAGIMWTGTFLLILCGTAIGMVGHEQHLPIVLGLMAHGLALSAAAATVTIRAMFIRQNRLLRNAFDLGVDAGSVASSVRRMR